MWNITWVTCTYTHLWTVLLPGAPPRSVITGQEVEAWPLTGGDGSSPEELWPYNQVIQLLYSRHKPTARSPSSQQNRTSWGLLILEAERASFHQPEFDLSRQPDRFQSHSCCSASRCTHTTMKTTDLNKSCRQNLLTLKHIISEPSATLRVLFRAERSSRTRWMTDINHLSEQQEALRPANTNTTSQKQEISSSYEYNEVQRFSESWSRTLVAFRLILSWCSRLQPTSSVERLLSHVLNTTLFKCIASYMYECWLFYCRIFILLKIFKLLKHNKNKTTLKQRLTELIFTCKLFMVSFSCLTLFNTVSVCYGFTVVSCSQMLKCHFEKWSLVWQLWECVQKVLLAQTNRKMSQHLIKIFSGLTLSGGEMLSWTMVSGSAAVIFWLCPKALSKKSHLSPQKLLENQDI